jgi:hypothetical protein
MTSSDPRQPPEWAGGDRIIAGTHGPPSGVLASQSAFTIGRAIVEVDTTFTATGLTSAPLRCESSTRRAGSNPNVVLTVHEVVGLLAWTWRRRRVRQPGGRADRPERRRVRARRRPARSNVPVPPGQVFGVAREPGAGRLCHRRTTMSVTELTAARPLARGLAIFVVGFSAGCGFLFALYAAEEGDRKWCPATAEWLAEHPPEGTTYMTLAYRAYC